MDAIGNTVEVAGSVVAVLIGDMPRAGADPRDGREAVGAVSSGVEAGAAIRSGAEEEAVTTCGRPRAFDLATALVAIVRGAMTVVTGLVIVAVVTGAD